MGAKCESCGMPMVKPEEFGGKNMKNKYCIHCTMPDGTLKSYDRMLAGMSAFMSKTQNLPLEDAKKKAKVYLATMPAWKGQ